MHLYRRHCYLTQVSLAERCLSNTCTLASSCLAIGSADVEFTDKLVDWSLELVQRGGEGQLGGVLRLLQVNNCLPLLTDYSLDLFLIS